MRKRYAKIKPKKKLAYGISSFADILFVFDGNML